MGTTNSAVQVAAGLLVCTSTSLPLAERGRGRGSGSNDAENKVRVLIDQVRKNGHLMPFPVSSYRPRSSRWTPGAATRGSRRRPTSERPAGDDPLDPRRGDALLREHRAEADRKEDGERDRVPVRANAFNQRGPAKKKKKRKKRKKGGREGCYDREAEEEMKAGQEEERASDSAALDGEDRADPRGGRNLDSRVLTVEVQVDRSARAALAAFLGSIEWLSLRRVEATRCGDDWDGGAPNRVANVNGEIADVRGARRL